MLKSKILSEPVLVGREREIKELQYYFDTAKEGRGSTVFVSGEAGTGKTRLIQEFLSFAKPKKRDVAMLSGWCLCNAGVPYLPFIEAFSNYFSNLSRESKDEELWVNSWLKAQSEVGLAGKTAYFSGQALKDQTFAAVTNILLRISKRKPVIIFIDDIHWADSASLALLHYISRFIASHRVLVVAAYRSEELNVDSEGHPHPLVETLRLMSRESLFEEVKLANLRLNDVLILVENMTGGCVESEFAEKLAKESQGNPLFIVESLRMLFEKGSFTQENNRWCLLIDKIGLPNKIKDIILRRIDNLKPEQRKLLDIASVIGSKFNPELLAAVIGQNNLQVLETLSAIARSSSIVTCEGNTYRFDHEKSKEAIYGEISPPLRQAYHTWVAEKLEAVSESRKLPVNDLAHHYAQAGNEAKAVKYALAAGQDAYAKWSNRQAIEYFTYVLHNISDEDNEMRRVALEGLGDSYTANCMYGEAIKTFDQLADSETGRLQLRAIRKAMDAAFLKGDKPDLLLNYAKKAEKLALEDRLEMGRIINNRARAFAWANRGDQKLDLADYNTALEIFEEENALEDYAEALWRSGEAYLVSPDFQEKRLRQLLLSRAIFRELGNVHREIVVTRTIGCDLIYSGFFTEARRELVNILKKGEELGVFDELARANGLLGLIDEHEGKLAEASSQVMKALEYSKKTDAKFIQGFDLAALTRIYSKLGDLKRADEYFDRMKKLPPEVLKLTLIKMNFSFSKGVYLAAKGRWEESNRVFEALGAGTNGLGLFGVEYAWALEKQGKAKEAAVQRTRVQKILKQSREKFEKADVQLKALMPREARVGEAFEFRLGLINVSKSPYTLISIGGVLPPDSRVISLPAYCSIQNSLVSMNKKKLGQFEVETVKIKMAFLKEGVYDFNPFLTYINEAGETRTVQDKSITVTVQLSSEDKLESVAEPSPKLDFKSEAAEKAFTFLVSALKEDYARRRMPLEKSGWRTLMEIANKTGASKHSLYGRSGRGGKTTFELERLSLVESRFFPGERGRGGNVLKIRICYKKENVKQWINLERHPE